MEICLHRKVVGAAALFVVLSANAQNADDSIGEVVVTGHPLSGEGLSQASKVLSGAELERKVSTNIGETLANEPGIHSSSFGKAVGRPVIHGLGGPRVRVMEDRIDALDISVTSADHAVTVDPFIADRIEVLKGSSALLYGSGAIGGVVDVHTNRIPHAVPENWLQGGVEYRFDDNTNGQATVVKLDGGSGRFAWHIDGTSKDGDDYEIPGFAQSARSRATEDEVDTTQGRGTLPGSAFESDSVAIGASYIAERGFIGASISRLDAEYGLPGLPPEDDETDVDAFGTPTLDLEQTRTDFELGIEDPFAGFTSLNVRLGINDYEHQEIEPSGEVGTVFSNEAWELQAELVYASSHWKGAFGIQHTSREFSAIGEEAFVVPVDTLDTGVFWVGQRTYDGFDLEAGLRIGRTDQEPTLGRSTQFTTGSGSLGLVIPIDDVWRLGLITDYSVRAPVGEELYSNGPHLTTGAFEVGDAGLNSERATNVSATLTYSGEVWSGAATIYYTWFDGFIYESATGAEEDGLPVFQFRQDDAAFVGVDFEVKGTIGKWDGGTLDVRGLFDFVDAELDVDGSDSLPRIPPLRYGVGVELNHGALTASINYTRSTKQDDVAAREFVTDAYDDLRLYVGVEVPMNRMTLGLFLSGRNLTDDEQRHHTSFIKEFAPAPGRTLEAGFRLLF